jgi:L-alanine-DL-glutamate epimerase-like enolase superfamily enzyme
MQVGKVEAKYLSVPIKIPLTEKPLDYGALLVTVETDTGIVGRGMTQEFEWHSVAMRNLIRHEIAPLVMGMDPLVPERIWHEVIWKAARADYRIRSGAVARACSAVDQALWDIRGKHLGEPVHRLLGGAHEGDIDVYITFGFNFYSREEIAELARRFSGQGHDKFKLQAVAADRGQSVDEDVARVKLVREIVGDGPRIMLDGINCYDLYHATRLARRIEPYDVTFLDEPVFGKDPRAMVELRRSTSVPIAARGRGGNIWDARELIALGAVDVLQANVLDSGGYTECLKVAHMAEMYQLPLATGGGWHLQNAHLIAAVSNGWMTEYHTLAALLCEAVFVDPPKPRKGKLPLTDKPGLGLEPNREAVREYAKE